MTTQSPTPTPSDRATPAAPVAVAVSVVVPIYNEAGSITSTVAQLTEALAVPDVEFEILLVDDGSSDASWSEIDTIDDPRVTALRHPKNRGYGAALKTGIRNARHDLVAITDADGTYPNDRLPDLLRRMERNDMVVGARTGDNVHIPTARKPAKRALNMLANYLSESDIPDLNSGLRVMRKEVVERFMRLLPDAFSFTTTITLAMISGGYRVEYVPVDYYHRDGNSKIHPIKDTVRFLQLVIRTVMYFNPLRVFLPLSLMLFAASFVALLYRVFFGGGLMVVSVILFVSAIQVLTTGMIADLIDKTSAWQRRR